MKRMLVLAVLVSVAGPASAQERLADQLKKGIVQEEANRNLDKAIEAYKGVVAQFDEERKVAATALFRLAECYRKAGKSEQAIQAYQRVVSEFPDQATVAEPSRKQLATTYHVPAPVAKAAPAPAPASARAVLPSGVGSSPLLTRTEQVRLDALQKEMALVSNQIKLHEEEIRKNRETGDNSEYLKLRRDLIDLQRRADELVASAADRSAAEAEARHEKMLEVEAEMTTVEARLREYQSKIEIGQAAPNDPAYVDLKNRLSALQRELIALRNPR